MAFCLVGFLWSLQLLRYHHHSSWQRVSGMSMSLPASESLGGGCGQVAQMYLHGYLAFIVFRSTGYIPEGNTRWPTDVLYQLTQLISEPTVPQRIKMPAKSILPAIQCSLLGFLPSFAPMECAVKLKSCVRMNHRSTCLRFSPLILKHLQTSLYMTTAANYISMLSIATIFRNTFVDGFYW